MQSWNRFYPCGHHTEHVISSTVTGVVTISSLGLCKNE